MRCAEVANPFPRMTSDLSCDLLYDVQWSHHLRASMINSAKPENLLNDCNAKINVVFTIQEAEDPHYLPEIKNLIKLLPC
jgi:hypothetical protein